MRGRAPQSRFAFKFKALISCCDYQRSAEKRSPLGNGLVSQISDSPVGEVHDGNEQQSGLV